MKFDEFKNYIIKNFKPDNSFFGKIKKYKDFLQEYNSHTNLTRLDKEENIWFDYFLVSILPFQYYDFSNNIKLLDIGSGSGIPGVVLKLLFPNISLTIIESNSKKTIFLTKLCEKLDISINILNKRAENILLSERNQFDVVTSRAVSELKNILEISLPYCKINGIVIEPKGKKIEDELKNAQKIISFTKTKLLNTYTIEIYNTIQNILYFQKTEDTQGIPRTWKEITK